jgi:hypothetical protein
VVLDQLVQAQITTSPSAEFSTKLAPVMLNPSQVRFPQQHREGREEGQRRGSEP